MGNWIMMNKRQIYGVIEVFYSLLYIKPWVDHGGYLYRLPLAIFVNAAVERCILHVECAFFLAEMLLKVRTKLRLNYLI